MPMAILLLNSGIMFSLLPPIGLCLRRPRRSGHNGRRQVAFFGLLSTACIQSVFGASLQIASPLQPIRQGCTLTIPVSFAAEGSSVTGIQFDLHYDTSLLDIQFTVGQATDQAGKRVFTGDLSGSGTRFLIVGINDGPITDGVAVDLKVSLKAPGDPQWVTLAVLNAAATDGDGHLVPFFVVMSAAPGRETGRRAPCRAKN